jgi:hypothetical protein
MDVRKAVISGKGDRLVRYVDKAIEEGCNLVRELGDKYKNITRGHLIINMNGFNNIQHGCIRCNKRKTLNSIHYSIHIILAIISKLHVEHINFRYSFSAENGPLLPIPLPRLCGPDHLIKLLESCLFETFNVGKPFMNNFKLSDLLLLKLLEC